MARHRKAIDPEGDPEALHDFRVCLRRVRTFLARLEPSASSPAVAAELSWLGRIAGEARDLDVQAELLRRGLREHLGHCPAAHPQIEGRLEVLRLEAHRRLGRALASPRYARMLLATRAELCAAPRERDEARGAGTPLPPAASTAALYRKALRQGRGLGPGTSDERFHRLRKTLKKLRYLLEANPRPHDATRVGVLGSLKDMQSVLGALNDSSVQRALLERLRSELGVASADRRDTSEAERCLDALLRMGDTRRHALKGEFVERFEALRTSRADRHLRGDPPAEMPRVR